MRKLVGLRDAESAALLYVVLQRLDYIVPRLKVSSAVTCYRCLEQGAQMQNTRVHQEAQLLARITVLERLVGMLVSDAMIGAGKGPEDILAVGEKIKAHLTNRAPGGATNRELHEAADKLFSSIASDLGNQGNGRPSKS